MSTTPRTRSATVRRRLLAGALAVSFVPMLASGSPTVGAAPATDLFMSEYIEVSSFNKAI